MSFLLTIRFNSIFQAFREPKKQLRIRVAGAQKFIPKITTTTRFAIITWNNPKKLEKPCITKGQTLPVIGFIFPCFPRCLWWNPLLKCAVKKGGKPRFIGWELPIDEGICHSLEWWDLMVIYHDTSRIKSPTKTNPWWVGKPKKHWKKPVDG